MFPRAPRALLAPRLARVVLLLCAASPLSGQTPTQRACTPDAHRVCTPKLDISVAEFRLASTGNRHTAVLQARFVNRSAAPLVLGYVTGSGLTLDDVGNRWPIFSPRDIRGIGVIGNTVDATFELQPGESAEASFEFTFQGAVNAIRGTTFTPSFAVREIDKLPSGQVRMGREYVVRFTALSNGARATAAEASTNNGTVTPSAGASTTAPSTSPPAAPPGGDTPTAVGGPASGELACAGRSRCQGTGPLTAEVVRVVGSGTQGRGHYLQVTVRVRNVSTQPLILGFRPGRVSGTDEHGQRYARDGNNEVRGMGLINNRGADPQFALAPGQSREATFGLSRYWGRTSPLGLRFAFDVALTELTVLPSRQVSVGREFALVWSDLTAGGTGADVQKGVDALKGLLKKRGGN